MRPFSGVAITRRTILAGAAASLASLSTTHQTLAAGIPARLIAAPGRQALEFGKATRLVDTWSYNGSVPGSLLRYRRGDRLDVLFENRLPEPSAVHWHGLRPPNMIEHQAGGMMTYLTVEGERA